MSSSANARSDYREQIRLARERVQAAAAAEYQTASSRQHGNSVSWSEKPTAVNTASAEGSGPSQMMQGRPQAPPQNQWPLGPYSSASSRSQEQTPASAAPTRPYRPELNSWFGTSSSSSSGDSRQPAQSASNRQQIRSSAQTESIYSQPETQEDQITAGPSRSSFVSHGTSHNSSISSIGEIPDFPVPQHEELYQPPIHSQSQLQPQSQAPVHSRRPTNLGPPPAASARRGTSSLYSTHQSYVLPIPEESPQSTPRRDRFSVQAASEMNLDPVDEDAEQTFLERASEDSKDSENDTLDPTDVAIISPGLLRQASIGRKAKPYLTLVRSGSRTIEQGVSPQTISEVVSPITVKHVGAMSSGSLTPRFVPSPPEPESAHPATSDKALERNDAAADPNSARSISPLTPVVERIIGGLEKGGALAQGVHVPQILEADSSSPITRPDAAHAVSKEDRVSTTSLADLIRRATRVRTNLDRGRTASRLGMLDMFSRSKDKLATYEKADRGSLSDSMSGMIGWMPPRALGAHEMTENMDKSLEEGASSRRAIKDKVRKNRRKRCCGMPRWLFFLLLVLLIACIAAAVIVPVELLVAAHQNGSTGINLANCQATKPCQNGGATVILGSRGPGSASSTCNCACVNGYTGNTCTEGPPTDGSCAQSVSDVPDVSGNLTLGSALPRLFVGLDSSFGVNLNVTALAANFNQANFSCSDENTLVTMAGQTKKRSAQQSEASSKGPLPTPAPSVSSVHAIELRLPHDDVTSLFTSGGIVLAVSATGTASSFPENATAAAPVPTTTSGTQNITSYEDFARVAVLFILQQSSNMTAAQMARSKLNAMFNMPIFQAQTIQFDGISVNVGQRSVSVNGFSQGGI